MIRFLLLDLDDTILDFKKAEHIAVRQAIRGAGVEPTDAAGTARSTSSIGR